VVTHHPIVARSRHGKWGWRRRARARRTSGVMWCSRVFLAVACGGDRVLVACSGARVFLVS
jgi:hypothetical protein